MTDDNASLRARPRRLRATPSLRSLVTEQRVEPRSLVLPLFVTAGKDVVRPLAALPGHAQRSVDRLEEVVDEAIATGIRSLLLFGIPMGKDATGSGAVDPDGPVPAAIRALRARYPSLVLIADICLCEYTDHGHCGVLAGGNVDNDLTLPLLGDAAVVCADAGADIVAPSAMMDGQVAAIRTTLDGAGHHGVAIMAYAAKFASALYGPFREAAGSTPTFGDRAGYQLATGNRREALREVALDIEQGADIIMVKPASLYLDIVRDVRERTDLPVAAYQVSGEYAMLKAAAERGWLDERRAVIESLTSIRRAGADIIITYYAIDAARWLTE